RELYGFRCISSEVFMAKQNARSSRSLDEGTAQVHRSVPSPQRSALMGRVRQAGTAPELVVRRILRSLGNSYRLNRRDLPGAPDLANGTKKWAIFVHGCFWHRHTSCPRASTPKTNQDFWRDKFEANKKRDQRNIEALRSLGFTVH